MKQVNKYLGKAFIISSIYLLTIILGGFFILPGVFQVDDYNFPLVIELFIKVTSAIAAIVVLTSAAILPGLQLIKKPKQRTKSPALIATFTLLVGLVFIFLHGLYVKLMTCPIDGNDAWHCQVEGKLYVGMLVIVFFLASLIGCLAWAIQKVTKKK